MLGVAPKTLRLAAGRDEIEGLHPLPDGPWLFRRVDLEGPAAHALRASARRGGKYPAGPHLRQESLFSLTV